MKAAVSYAPGCLSKIIRTNQKKFVKKTIKTKYIKCYMLVQMKYRVCFITSFKLSPSLLDAGSH